MVWWGESLKVQCFLVVVLVAKPCEYAKKLLYVLNGLTMWMKKVPHTKPDKLNRGLHGGLTNSEA